MYGHLRGAGTHEVHRNGEKPITADHAVFKHISRNILSNVLYAKQNYNKTFYVVPWAWVPNNLPAVKNFENTSYVY